MKQCGFEWLGSDFAARDYFSGSFAHGSVGGFDGRGGLTFFAAVFFGPIFFGSIQRYYYQAIGFQLRRGGR